MSNTTVLDTSRSDVPLVRIIAVELRKSVDTLAGRWMLIVIGILTAFVDVVVVSFSNLFNTGGANLSTLLWAQMLVMLPIVGAMAILVATSEWTQRTAMVTFALVPQRWKTLVAKGVVVLAIGAAAVLWSLAVGGLLTLSSGEWDLSFGELLPRFLTWFVFLAQALALGFLFLNSAAAIVTFYTLFVVGAFIVRTALVVSVFSNPERASSAADKAMWINPYMATSDVYHSAGWPTGEQWGQLLTSSAIWVLIPLAIGVWRILRAEVK
jgi:ABC-2 type transport system permease protein